MGGGDSEIARTIRGPSRGVMGVDLSDLTPRDLADLSDEMTLLPPTRVGPLLGRAPEEDPRGKDPRDILGYP